MFIYKEQTLNQPATNLNKRKIYVLSLIRVYDDLLSCRVEMFREFIEMDKASRKMAGEVDGPASQSVAIVVRRGHIVEDGFRQLNSLGPKLKSSIHVSFVSESGLPEAGLDYGGLSKEFLTDISKAAFSPE